MKANSMKIKMNTRNKAFNNMQSFNKHGFNAEMKT